MKKIGFFLGDIHGSGGISRVTWILANKLNEKFEVYMLANYHNPEVRYEYADNIKISYLFEDKKSNHKRMLKMVKGVRAFIKENGIDVLICTGAIYYPPAVLAVKGTKVKLVCWEHSNVTVNNEHKFARLCRWFGAKGADLIVTLTKADAKMYGEKFGVDNVISINNPVDDALICDVHYDAESKKIISVGRLCYPKNFELLVDVADVILNKYPGWEWHIYGEGENRQSIEDKISNCKLNDRLLLMGRVEDLYERYSGYSFLVMTSRYEGFPMTLLESTAKGLPAVSFDILTGPNEIIDDGKTGYLVEPENVGKMCEKISILIDDVSLRQKMSDECVSKRECFTCDAIVGQWTDVLERL